MQDLSHAVARALARSGVRAGDKVAILSGNDAHAFACVFGIARRGAVWCPINPRNTAAENRELLALFDCVALIYARSYAEVVDGLDLPTAGLPRRRWTPGSATGRRLSTPTRASRPTTR